MWGVFLLARSALRLVVLLEGGVGGYVVIVFLTGPPLTLGLIAWSVWYAVRSFSDDDETERQRSSGLADPVGSS